MVDSVISGALEAVAGLGVLVKLVLGGVDDGIHDWLWVEDDFQEFKVFIGIGVDVRRGIKFVYAERMLN